MAKVDEAMLESTVLPRETAEVGSSFVNETLEDLGRNADLYVFNQGVEQDQSYGCLAWAITIFSHALLTLFH